MVELQIIDGGVRVKVLGWDQLWAFKTHLEFPLDCVVGVRRWDPAERSAFRGLRAPGTALPGVIVAGTYHRWDAGRWRHDFFDVHDFQRAIVIELRGQWYHRLVVEVADVEAALRRLAPNPEPVLA